MLNVVQKVTEAKTAKIRLYPCHTNRASELGHECERYLYYLRANWKDRALHSSDLEFIFEAGRRIEDEAVDELKEAGWLISEQNRAFEWPKFNLTGHLDLKLSEKGSQTAYPCEVKGLQHYEWQKLNTIEDFHNSKKPWVRKYPAQLFLYLLLSNIEDGFFYIKSKSTHKPKEIWVKLNWEYTEGLLKKAERINWAVSSNTPPNRIDYNEQICGKCPFAHICLKDIDYGPGTEIIDAEELLGWLKEREELKPLHKKYEDLDEAIKLIVKERPSLIVGNYLIQGKWQERQGKKFWISKIINKELKAQIGEE